MPTASPARTRRSGVDVATELLDAAEEEFAAHGFAGASTHRIAERAEAHQPQINYHFGSKEELWRSVVDRLFSELDAAIGADAGPPSQLLGDVLIAFVRFSAARPELNRIINLEATSPTERLAWLVDAHLAGRRAQVGALWDLVCAETGDQSLSSDDVWDLMTSFGALHFANAPMIDMLSDDGIDQADEHARKLLRLLRIEGRL